MTVRIAQFNHSETGGIWGVPGDQLKVPGTYETAKTFSGELEIVYWSGTWDYVFRPISAGIATMLAAKADATVRNPHVGYSQNNPEAPRTSFYEALKAAKWDPSKITKDVNGDCSSGMAAWLNSVGIEVDPNMWTGSEKEELEKTGRFLTLTHDLFTDSDAYLMKGDILLRTGHTCMVLDYGDNVKSDVPGETTGDSWQRMKPYANKSSAGIQVVKRGGFVNASLPVLGGKWWITDHNGTRGWESANLIEWDYMLRITGYLVNVRKKPNINSEIIGTVMAGESHPATGISAVDSRGVVWYQMTYRNEIGWASGAYVEFGGYA